MKNAELQLLMRDRLGLRIEPEMSKYLTEKSAESDQLIAAIGCDAHTGVPRREMISPQLLREKLP